MQARVGDGNTIGCFLYLGLTPKKRLKNKINSYIWDGFSRGLVTVFFFSVSSLALKIEPKTTANEPIRA
jgi:hypothetical protein